MEVSPVIAEGSQHLEGAKIPSKPDEMREAARQFEAMLLRQFISEAFKPMLEGGASGGPGKDVYQYLMTDVLAETMSQSESFGFSNLIQLQLAGSGRQVSPGSHK